MKQLTTTLPLLLVASMLATGCGVSKEKFDELSKSAEARLAVAQKDTPHVFQVGLGDLRRFSPLNGKARPLASLSKKCNNPNLFSPCVFLPSSNYHGKLTLKEESATPTKHKSNYQRIKEQDQKKKTLRYKTKQTKENPFFSFYRQEQKQQQQEKPKAPAKKPQQPPQKDFFSFSNTDAVANKVLFQAVFRESQAVQAGKPLRIFLEEPIEALKLKQGTLLKSIPRLEGNRIKIDITAAIIDKQVRPVHLVCLDQEDCLEGLYHDALAARLEEDIQEGIVEELWDIGLEQHEVTRKGGRLAKKLSPKHTEDG